MSHITVVVDDLVAAEKFYVDVLDAVPLPDQAATVDGGTARHVLVGEDTILELLAPGDGDSVAARDLARVGPSVTGVTFTVTRRGGGGEVPRARRRGRMIAEVTDHELRFDVTKTWGCEYRLTDRVLTGDPRAVTAAAMVGASVVDPVARRVGGSTLDVVVGDAVDRRARSRRGSSPSSRS